MNGTIERGGTASELAAELSHAYERWDHEATRYAAQRGLTRGDSSSMAWEDRLGALCALALDARRALVSHIVNACPEEPATGMTPRRGSRPFEPSESDRLEWARDMNDDHDN